MDELIDEQCKILHNQTDRRRNNRFLIVMGLLSAMTVGLVSFAFVSSNNAPKKPVKQVETKIQQS